MLRFGARHDSGVLYHQDAPGEVWVDSIADVVPTLVSTGDFAPADMQYRMHRQHLWDPESGLYGERFDVDNEAWVRPERTARGNARVAEAMARALRIGGEGTPSEMRGRWQRQTSALIAACSTLDLDAESVELLSRAGAIGAEDGWFG